MKAGSDPFGGKSSFGQRLLEGLQCICFAPDSAPECQVGWRVEQFWDLQSSKHQGFVAREAQTGLSSLLYGRVRIFKDG